MSQPPGAVGQALASLDTPCLIVDLDRLDQNIRTVAEACRVHSVGWRPHVKGHKCPAIAHRQLAAGAHGITCAKLGEAEVMAQAGIGDIMVANQIVGAGKIERLVRLQRSARVMAAVDDAANAAEIAAAARQAGVVVPLVIEVEVGMRRAGVLPGAPVADLARAIASLDGVEFAGLMWWEAPAAQIADPAAKEKAVAEAAAACRESARLCREAGLAVPILSCGGTATYPYSVRQKGVTEIQAGGAIFSDVRYRTKCGIDHPWALFVLATVTSRPTPRRIVADAGKKAMSGDYALPLPLDIGDVADVRLSAEHVCIDLDADADQPRPGDKLQFVVGYSDTTVHLHDRMIGLRDGIVETIWPILGRGRFD